MRSVRYLLTGEDLPVFVPGAAQALEQGDQGFVTVYRAVVRGIMAAAVAATSLHAQVATQASWNPDENPSATPMKFDEESYIAPVPPPYKLPLAFAADDDFLPLQPVVAVFDDEWQFILPARSGRIRPGFFDDDELPIAAVGQSSAFDVDDWTPSYVARPLTLAPPSVIDDEFPPYFLGEEEGLVWGSSTSPLRIPTLVADDEFVLPQPQSVFEDDAWPLAFAPHATRTVPQVRTDEDEFVQAAGPSSVFEDDALPASLTWRATAIALQPALEDDLPQAAAPSPAIDESDAIGFIPQATALSRASLLADEDFAPQQSAIAFEEDGVVVKLPDPAKRYCSPQPWIFGPEFGILIAVVTLDRAIAQSDGQITLGGDFSTLSLAPVQDGSISLNPSQ